MNLIRAILICWLLSPCIYAADPPAATGTPAWLSGSWKLEANGRTVEEHWTTPAGGAMLGMSRTIKNGKMVEFEFLRIEQRNGALVYVAQPQGAPPTEFRLTSSSENEVVFSNLQHDFPQRIRYRRNQDGSVTARIEDESGKKGVDFNYVSAH